MSDKRSLFANKWFIWLLLFVSLGSNCGALIYPFVILREGIGNEVYTLFHSIRMLWSEDLYVLSVLVVVFSVLFPFAKLGVLMWVHSASKPRPVQLSLLAWVERLGKWSMLDVFLVSIILSLASRQFLVAAKPQLGLNLFILAILLSMLAGELIAKRLAIGEMAQRVKRGRGGIWLFALSGVTLLAAVGFPFLQIDDWLLKDRAYSIISLVPALWVQEARLPSLLAAVFLLLAPLLSWFFSLVAWASGNSSSFRMKRAQLLQRWNMIDVFGFALFVFALESDRLMDTELYWGALFLGATIALQSILFWLLRRVPKAGQS